jgi:hypothetical protein
MKNLPSNALRLISEYSKPVTRPEWRTLRKLAIFDIYLHVYCNLKPQTPLMKLIFHNIEKTAWYKMYSTIKLVGLHKASIKYNMSLYKMLKIKGMKEAVTYHTFWGEEQ